MGLSIAHDLMTGKPFPNVYIVLVPTDNSTTISAHLHWGSWNECPAPEYHVAALRHWRDAYGAELVGLGRDTIDLKVARKPATRDEALELARVQYAYCNDIIDQGTRSYSVLAAGLMADDWWFFLVGLKKASIASGIMCRASRIGRLNGSDIVWRRKSPA